MPDPTTPDIDAGSFCEPTCCAGTNPSAVTEDEPIRQAVRDGYARIARGEGSSCCGSTETDATRFAQQVGYDADELESLPDGANLGLSCGNPTALAALSPGEVVLDLGSGAGFDVFIAASQVGPTGQVIGVDMTAEMIDRARAVNGWTMQDVRDMRMTGEHCNLIGQQPDIIQSLKDYGIILSCGPDYIRDFRNWIQDYGPGTPNIESGRKTSGSIKSSSIRR